MDTTLNSYNNSDESSSNGSKRQKQNRSSRACLVCRQRKVKCDAVECFPDKCTNCAQFNIENCVLPVPKKRRSTKIDELLKTHSNIKLSTDQSEHNNNGNHYISLFDSGIIVPDVQDSYPNMNVIELDPKNVLKQKLELMSNKSESAYWLGPVSKGVLESYISTNLKTSAGPFTIDKTDFDYLLKIGCFMLPSEETCWKWIDCFFSSRYLQLPIVLEHKFREDYKDLRNPPSLLLLQTILYTGARFYTDHSQTEEDHVRQMEMSDILYKRAKALLDKKVEADPVCEVQASLLIGNYKSRNRLHVETDFSFIKKSLDISYAIGIHKNPASLTNVSDSKKKLYKRIWWSIFSLDTLYSLILDRPWTVDSIFLDDVPFIEEDDLKETSEVLSPERHYGITYFVYRTRLLLCIRKICENIVIYKKTQKSFNSLLGECDKMLKNWIENLPPSLIFKVNLSSNNELNASLFLEYYIALLILHRFHVLQFPNLNKGDNAPSWGIVFKAAHMVEIISRYLVDNEHIYLSQNAIPFAVNISAVMLMYHLYNKDKTIQKVAKKTIEAFLALLQSVPLNYPHAYVTYFYIKSIYEDKSKHIGMINSIIRQNERTLKSPNNVETKFSIDNQISSTRPNSAMDSFNINNNHLLHYYRYTTPNASFRQYMNTTTSIPANSHLYHDLPKLPEMPGIIHKMQEINPENKCSPIGRPLPSLSPGIGTTPAPILEPIPISQGGAQSSSIATVQSVKNKQEEEPQKDEEGELVQKEQKQEEQQIKPITLLHDQFHQPLHLNPDYRYRPTLRHTSNTPLTEGFLPYKQTVHSSLDGIDISSLLSVSPSVGSNDIPLIHPHINNISNISSNSTMNNGSFKNSSQQSIQLSNANNNHWTYSTMNNRNNVNSHLLYDIGSNNHISHSTDTPATKEVEKDVESIVSKDLAVLMFPDTVPDIDTFNWQPEFDTKLLGYTEATESEENIVGFDQFWYDFMNTTDH